MVFKDESYSEQVDMVLVNVCVHLTNWQQLQISDTSSDINVRLLWRAHFCFACICWHAGRQVESYIEKVSGRVTRHLVTIREYSSTDVNVGGSCK